MEKKTEQFWKVNEILKWILIAAILCGTIFCRFWMNLPDTWIDYVPFDNPLLGEMTIVLSYPWSELIAPWVLKMLLDGK